MSIRVGIFFGGASREREVSFAGGRTVYDNLDKSLYTAIPYFVDQRGNIIELNWPFIYRGTIRDFFPPSAYLPESEHHFQIYADSLQLDDMTYDEMLQSIGSPVKLEDLKHTIDIAFLALHGRSGEDGSIQGLLEFLGIPYTGSGIGSSALGMNKALQKRLMAAAFDVPAYEVIAAQEWHKADKKELFDRCLKTTALPLVIKPANQGSSLGVSVIEKADQEAFERAVEQAFFRYKLTKTGWENRDKIAWIRQLCDVREGIGLPLLLNGRLVYHPEDLLNALEEEFVKMNEVVLEALDHENEVIVESFLKGREFSCVVVMDDNGKPMALPPTEILKGGKIYTYQGKYLPGLSRKLTPIACDSDSLLKIRKECERLFSFLGFEVYARIDGFLDEQGRVFLNDPNTTSGMMPSSFFFHQAAEIGLDPSHFVTYILRTSLAERLRKQNILHPEWKTLLEKIDNWILQKSLQQQKEKRIAVIMGGYSSERHISVESGRNIYEKIGSSAGYTAIPLFLTGSDQSFRLWQIPISMMLKDNADDIRAHIEKREVTDDILGIRQEFRNITQKYAGTDAVFEAEEWDFKKLKQETDAVFIALHGRPGEDGELQKQLTAYGIPFNGSGVESSQLTINKYLTNQLLREKGFLVADHMMVERDKWEQAREEVLRQINGMGYPLIAKPADDGCSSAVKKIANQVEMEAYAAITFRSEEKIPEKAASLLHLGQQEEFPARDYFLIEHFIDRQRAERFLEITGGMLTSFGEDGHIKYEIFEASEALAGGEVLSLAEKFLAGEGQNITPARYHKDPNEQQRISEAVKAVFKKVARTLNIEGYCRIDAFVRIFANGKVEVIIIEVNSLPGMTPATCIYHQAAINGYKPADFIDRILDYGQKRQAYTKQD